jgi:hypothetical protein
MFKIWMGIFFFYLWFEISLTCHSKPKCRIRNMKLYTIKFQSWKITKSNKIWLFKKFILYFKSLLIIKNLKLIIIEIIKKWLLFS